MNKKILAIAFCICSIPVLKAQDNEYPTNGNVVIYQNSNEYRAFDVVNQNDIKVSRFEATDDGSGQLWLKDVNGDFKVYIRSNTIAPSAIAGELIIGEFTNISKNKKLYVNGDAHITGSLSSNSNLILSQTSNGIYRAFDVENFNSQIVSRLEATGDGSGQLWLKDANGNFRILFRSNIAAPSSIVGDLVIGEYATASKGQQLYVNGNTQLNGSTIVNNELRFKNDNSMKGIVWGSETWSRFYSRIDDYEGNLRILSDDHIFFGDINSTSGLPSGESSAAFYINTNTKSVGIGTTNTHDYSLTVAGNILTEEVKVASISNWPDYVFEPEYDLMSLDLLKSYIDEHQHLPEIKSEEEVKENGIELGSMNAKLLKKIEELTLYLINQNETNKEQTALIQKQSELIDALNKRLEELSKD